MYSSNHVQPVVQALGQQPTDRCFQRVVGLSRDHVTLLDAQGKIIYANTVEALLGYSLIDYQTFAPQSLVHPADGAKAQTFWQAVYATPNTTTTTELRYRHHQGHYVWLEVTATNLLDDYEVGAIVTYHRGLPEPQFPQQQTQPELVEEQNLLRILLDSVSDYIFVKDSQHRFIFGNQALAEILGYASPNELIGKSDFDHFPAALAERFHTAEAEILRTGQAILENEDCVPGRMGDHWLSINKWPFHNLKGERCGIIGIVRNINDRKQREQQLRFDAALQAAAKDAIIVTDLALCIRSWNPSAEHIYGWSAAEVIGRHIDEVIQPLFPSGKLVATVIQEFWENGEWSGEVIQRHKDGRLLHIMTSTGVFKDEAGHPLGVFSLNCDISEQKKAAQLLQAKHTEEVEFHKQLQILYESVIELTLSDELDEFYKQVVELGLTRLGFDRMALFLYDATQNQFLGTYGTDETGQLRAEHAYRFTADPDWGTWKALQTPKRFYLEENVDLYYDNIVVGKGWRVYVALWHGGQIIGSLLADNLFCQRPLTPSQLEILAQYGMSIAALLARKQIVEALRNSEKLLRTIIQNLPVGVWLLDGTGKTTQTNAVGEQIWHGVQDVKIEELASVYKAWWPDTGRPLYNDEWPDVRALTKGETTLNQELEIAAFDGTRKYILSSAIPLRNEQQNIQGALIVNQDITERKQNEQLIRQALETVKELSELKSRFVSMASHEFRTPLASIFSLAETLTTYWPKLTEQQINQRLAKIKEQVGYLQSLMEDVLQLVRMEAKRVEFQPVLLDFDEICRQVIDEFQDQLQSDQQIVYTCTAAAKQLIHADPKLLRQIVNNLLSNAIKYSPPSKPIRINLDQTAQMFIFTIRDEGIGIPPADLKHLFEPFHRASNVGTIAGTGLGMVIVKEAVELHGGRIHIESQIGSGTTFTVSFPVTQRT